MSDSSLSDIIALIADIFECEPNTLSASTRLLKDLPCESIDLLEIATRLSRLLGQEVQEDAIFLSSLRVFLAEAQEAEQDGLVVLAQHYPWLSTQRLQALIDDACDLDPLLTIADLAAYIDYHRTR